MPASLHLSPAACRQSQSVAHSESPSETNDRTLTPMTMAAPKTRSWMRPLYFLLGLAALAVGIVGIFLPLVPTTGPLLIAVFAFARSSDRLHDWLMNHRLLGRFISDFRSGRGIPKKMKVVAVVTMTVTFTYSVGWIITHPLAKAIVAAIGVWAIWYVLRFPTVRPE